MTTSESDNFEQAVDGAVRSAVTQAAALGRMVAQMREQALQSAARREEALAAEMQRRYEAERQYARVMLSQADHDGWWNTASTERVASVVATGQAWKDKDPEIARLASRLDDRAQARWGIRPSARIDALTPTQRRREAQQLVAMLSLDRLDKDDPLHTFVTELHQPEPAVDQGEEIALFQLETNAEVEHVTVELTPEERAFLLEHLSDYESEQIDRYESLELGERDDFGSNLYDNVQRAATLRNKLRPREADRATDSKPGEQSHAIERDKLAAKDTREQSIDEFEQLMRSNGLDEATIQARILPERANAKSAQEAANTKPSIADKPKNRGGRSHNRQRDTERGR